MRVVAVSGLLGLALLAAATVTDATEPLSDRATLEDELRRAESGFAQSMADRDHVAFVAFLHDDVVFFDGNEQLRGKQAVAQAWKPYFEGPDAPFAWAPEAVAVLDSGELGMTSGPVTAPGGRRVSTFNSVWRRTSEGEWKIVFDRGCPPCEHP